MNCIGVVEIDITLGLSPNHAEAVEGKVRSITSFSVLETLKHCVFFLLFQKLLLLLCPSFPFPCKVQECLVFGWVQETNIVKKGEMNL